MINDPPNILNSASYTHQQGSPQHGQCGTHASKFSVVPLYHLNALGNYLTVQAASSAVNIWDLYSL